MSDYYRFKIGFDRNTSNYTARCKQTGQVFSAKTKNVLWTKIKKESGYGVNRHFRRNGIWICVEKILPTD